MANPIKWIDDRVPASRSTCPPPGSIHWGHIRKPVKGDGGFGLEGASDKYADYVAEYSYDETWEECASFAGDMLRFSNDLVLKNLDQRWESDVFARWERGRGVRKELMDDEKAQLSAAYWTFNTKPESASFGASCRVYWNCAGTELAADKDAVSGVVEAKDRGMRTACVLPRYTKDCLLNPIKGGCARRSPWSRGRS